jgi:hypothetical protein
LTIAVCSSGSIVFTAGGCDTVGVKACLDEAAGGFEAAESDAAAGFNAEVVGFADCCAASETVTASALAVTTLARRQTLLACWPVGLLVFVSM